MKPSSSSKPISSPGRALVEKFPPPLTRFLRSNVGTKSGRGKSKATVKAKPKAKASPLFFWKKTATDGYNAQQEPSSPKVTCIGQVRVRRSKNAPSRSRQQSKQSRCRFGRKFLRCRSKEWRLMWRKWVRFFCFPSAKVRTGSSRAGSNSNRVEEDESRSRSCRTQEEEESEDRESEREGVASVSTPPKNALLLTRCRSEPYRWSSLACRLWGEEQDENGAQKPTEDEREKGAVPVLEALGTEPGGRDSASETRANRSDIGSASVEKKEEEEEGRPPPPLMVLMRSRSEPVMRGSGRLDPLTSEFGRDRRLSESHTSTQSCTPHAVH